MIDEKQILLGTKAFLFLTSAYLTSGIAVELIGGAVPFSIPTAKVERSSQKASQTFGLDHYKQVWEKNIFNPEGTSTIQAPTETEVKVEGKKTDSVDVAGIPLSSLNYKLVGTVTGPAARSFCVIFVPEEKQQKLFRRGDHVGKATIIDILRNKVILDNAGRREMLEVVFDTKVAGARAASKKWSPTGGGVKKVSANKFILDKKEVENLSGDVSRFMTQVRVVPNMASGKPAGYKLLNIKPGSLIDKIGLKNGDVVREINGRSINKPEEAFLAYQQVKGGSGFTVSVERRGKQEQLYYEIR